MRIDVYELAAAVLPQAPEAARKRPYFAPLHTARAAGAPGSPRRPRRPDSAAVDQHRRSAQRGRASSEGQRRSSRCDGRAILSVCCGCRRLARPIGTPLGLPAACPRPSMRPPPLRAHWRRSEPTARSHSGCGSAGASAPRNGASGAHLARRRGAAAGGVGRVCAVCAPRPRTLRRGGAPAALAHRRGRRGRAALRPLAVRPLRCVVWAAQRRRRLRRGGQGSATASRT